MANEAVTNPAAFYGKFGMSLASLYAKALQDIIDHSNVHGFWNREQEIAEAALELAKSKKALGFNLGLMFVDVLPGLKEGKKYRRKAWVEGVFITFEPGMRFITLHGKTGIHMRWTPYQDDFDGEDWEEVQ
ncbi:MAG: hypothetical protein WC565_04420 [Parcubacteria group bacterium]